MDLPPQLLQFLGSLAGVLALAALAQWLRLGPKPRLSSDEEARAAADEAVSGFDPIAISLDREGHGALLRDKEGRILLLRPHGTHFAGRILTPAASMSCDGETLRVDTAEKRYGVAELVIEAPSTWMQALEAIRDRNHA